MAAEAGRDLRIKYDADGSGAGEPVVLAGARTDSFTINNEMIDITDKDDNGVRTLLNDIGVKSLALSCTGVLKDNTLMALADEADQNAALHTFEIDIGTIRRYRGLWFITSFEVTGEQQDTITFSMSLESSGAITATTP